MQICLGLAVLLLAAPGGSETPGPKEAVVVAYAKKIDVAKLDPTLKSQSLEDWLRLGPARVEKLEWRMSDCDLTPDFTEPAAGYPLCAKLVYQRSRVSGWIIITVGTKRNGIVGQPRFEYAVISMRTERGVRFENAQKLSELPAVISKLLPDR